MLTGVLTFAFCTKQPRIYTSAGASMGSKSVVFRVLVVSLKRLARFVAEYMLVSQVVMLEPKPTITVKIVVLLPTSLPLPSVV